MSDMSDAYFKSISSQISRIEGEVISSSPQVNTNEFGEVDGSELITPTNENNNKEDLLRISLPDTSDTTIPTIPLDSMIPSINSSSIDGIVDLYTELNKKYDLDFDVTSVNSITSTFKAIVEPRNREIFKSYLRESIDRLKLVCLSQLSNTVYVLIGKLTSEEAIMAMTIQERMELLDRLFDYMDRINIMAGILPKGDSNLELKEISSGGGSSSIASDEDSMKLREIVKYLEESSSETNSKVDDAEMEDELLDNSE